MDYFWEYNSFWKSEIQDLQLRFEFAPTFFRLGPCGPGFCFMALFKNLRSYVMGPKFHSL